MDFIQIEDNIYYARLPAGLVEQLTPFNICIDGRYHYIGEPFTGTYHYVNGSRRCRIAFIDGMVGCKDKPAIEMYMDNKCVLTVWANDGNISREDGPAIATSDGLWVYAVDGIIHRNDGAAIYQQAGDHSFHRNIIHGLMRLDVVLRIEERQASIISRKKYKNGLLHCRGGPAVIQMGQPDEYWINGTRVNNWSSCVLLVGNFIANHPIVAACSIISAAIILARMR
jgi:hypothetical protein